MAVFKRRLFVWLIRAYIRRWSKRILFLIILGVIAFFALLNLSRFLIPWVIKSQRITVGVVGAYTLDSLPSFILDDLSTGLTKVSRDGTTLPSVAKSWKIENNGKKYIFYLKNNVHFTDGELLTSDKLNYSFSDVPVQRPNKFTIVFNLKESYSPFLITVSKPIFKNGFVGVGKYRIKDINLNGTFVQSISLVSVDGAKTITYQFYPTQEALATAYLLGEVNIARGLNSARYKNFDFSGFVNTKVVKTVDYSHLVTIFFNTQDPVLSDVKLRDALSYSLPDNFSSGLRNYMPLSPFSWAFDKDLQPKTQDYTHARLLLLSSSVGSSSAGLSLKIETLPLLLPTADIVRENWEKLGIKVSVKTVDAVPSKFQIFLGSFILPQDPDEYALWHSGQNDNISNYKNLRIDKLLEDGRKNIDLSQRKAIYMDFQKYLLADSPAIFLYFPYIYDLYRK